MYAIVHKILCRLLDYLHVSLKPPTNLSKSCVTKKHLKAYILQHTQTERQLVESLRSWSKCANMWQYNRGQWPPGGQNNGKGNQTCVLAGPEDQKEQAEALQPGPRGDGGQQETKICPKGHRDLKDGTLHVDGGIRAVQKYKSDWEVCKAKIYALVLKHCPPEI